MSDDSFSYADAYGRVADRYLALRHKYDNSANLMTIAEALPRGASLLDVGCGAGVPVAQFFANRDVTVYGLDISPRQIELARKLVPGAEFEVADLMSTPSGAYSVDCVVAFYMLYHIPRNQHLAAYQRLRSFLRPEGILFALIGTKDWEGSKDDFFGGPMRWSSFGVERELELMREAGFTVLSSEADDAGGESHHAVLLQAT